MLLSVPSLHSQGQVRAPACKFALGMTDPAQSDSPVLRLGQEDAVLLAVIDIGALAHEKASRAAGTFDVRATSHPSWPSLARSLEASEAS